MNSYMLVSGFTGLLFGVPENFICLAVLPEQALLIAPIVGLLMVLVLFPMLLPQIERYEFDQSHMNVFTKDGRNFLITTPDAQEILGVLKEAKWIE